jgi:hypothetical protein
MIPVKITTSGKVRITVSKSLKPTFLSLLELFLGNLEDSLKGKPLHWNNNSDRVYRFLIEDLYFKYHTELSIINQNDSKVLLTRAQAHTFWELCQNYSDVSLDNPQMGYLLSQLYQKLL